MFNTQHHKVWIKDKWNNPGKGVAPSPKPRCSSYWKGSIRITILLIYSYNSHATHRARLLPPHKVHLSLAMVYTHAFFSTGITPTHFSFPVITLLILFTTECICQLHQPGSSPVKAIYYTNLASNTWRVSGELGIAQASRVRHFYEFGKKIWNCRVVSHVTILCQEKNGKM